MNSQLNDSLGPGEMKCTVAMMYRIFYTSPTFTRARPYSPQMEEVIVYNLSPHSPPMTVVVAHRGQYWGCAWTASRFPDSQDLSVVIEGLPYHHGVMYTITEFPITDRKVRALIQRTIEAKMGTVMPTREQWACIGVWVGSMMMVFGAALLIRAPPRARGEGVLNVVRVGTKISEEY